VVQNRINEDKGRIATIEQEIDELNRRVLKSTPSPMRNERPRWSTMPTFVTTISAWNELQNLVRNDTALKQLSERTALRVDADHIVVTRHSIERLRASLLAGVGMLVAMIILTIVVSPPRRTDGKLGRIDLTER
jgi:hypothetical protein